MSEVRGWCPGAWRPMESGDGFVMRVRPRMGRISAEAMFGFCDLAEAHGNGVLELTRRANVQIRGVSEAGIAPVLDGLDALGLLDPDPAVEARRNILVQPFWQAGDVTDVVASALTERLVADVRPASGGEYFWTKERGGGALGLAPPAGLAKVDAESLGWPGKFGFAVDTGEVRVLAGDPADIRVERSVEGGLMVRLEGCATGRAVSDAAAAVNLALEAAEWFLERRGALRRMAPVVARGGVPERLTGDAEPAGRAAPRGGLAGVLFGQISAAEMRNALARTEARGVRLTPWRSVLWEDARAVAGAPFLAGDDPDLGRVDACPGAPRCGSATVATRDVARALMGAVRGNVHVSGCAKGCARSTAADMTLVGRDGRFDLVRGGCSWEEPAIRGLAPDQVIEALS